MAGISSSSATRTRTLALGETEEVDIVGLGASHLINGPGH
jgi:hypothetical protein